MYHGQHLLRHWSKLQSGVALSSGEAELYAANKCAQECLGIQQLILDLGHHVNVEIVIDAAATRGMVHRRGQRKMKHIAVQELWLQQVVAEKQVTVVKIRREDNLADVLAHHWGAAEVGMFRRMSMQRVTEKR